MLPHPVVVVWSIVVLIAVVHLCIVSYIRYTIPLDPTDPKFEVPARELVVVLIVLVSLPMVVFFEWVSYFGGP